MVMQLSGCRACYTPREQSFSFVIMTGVTDGARASKLSVKAVNPKSPAAFFAAQEHSVQKSAKSEPGRKIRSVSADVPGGLEHRPSGSHTGLQDAEISGRSYKSKPGSPILASPKGHAIAPLKVQSRAASGRETPITGRSQVIILARAHADNGVPPSHDVEGSKMNSVHVA